MKTILLLFAVMSIVTQIPHAFWAINFVSNLKTGKFLSWDVNWRVIQNSVSCLILGFAILFCVLLGLTWIAVLWAIVDILINCYYVRCSNHEKYMEIDLDLRSKNSRDEIKLRRMKEFGAYFFSVLFPAMIFEFTYLYVNYEILTR